MSIERPILNITFLEINSIAITKPKYANKALRRLDKLLDKVSEIRSMFGAVQNRLEHAINNSDNTGENTSSILQQAAQAIMVQSNSTYQGVISLLQ